MMPLRVAMPKSVMKPTSDATESTPPCKNADHAADQRERQVDHDEQRVAAERNARKSSRKIPAMTSHAEHRMRARRLACSLSNWPP